MYKVIQEHVKQLINNLEIPYTRIVNNYILNNFRSLYIISQIFSEKKLNEISKLIFKIYSQKLISKDGFLIEGSSHYQFIVTKWMLEVTIISKAFKDNKFYNLINETTKKMLEKCQYFSFANNKKYIELPRIGDVSPDFPIDWFQPFKTKFGWSAFWKSKPQKILSNLENLYIDGWYKETIDNFVIFKFFHPKKDYYPFGHSHDDFQVYISISSLHQCL